MDWAFNNLAESLLILGILLLVIEVAVFGFSTFVLFFVGCAAVVTAGLLYVGIIPDTGLSAMLSTCVLTGLSAVLLWKSLNNMHSLVVTTIVNCVFVVHNFLFVVVVPF